MIKSYITRNICIGVIDGITIPLVLAAALSRREIETPVIFIGCIAVAIAGSITMTASSFIEGKKNESDRFTFGSAMMIGFSYLLGGILVALPFGLLPYTSISFRFSVVVASLLLLAAGFAESRFKAGNGWSGALRAWITAMLAAGAVYLAAGLW